MARIKKIKDNGTTIYPATIPQGVIDPENGWSIKTAIDDILSVLGGSTNLSLVISDLRQALSPDGGDLSVFCDKVNNFLNNAGASKGVIDSWKEIEDFLAGVTDAETLTGLLNDTLQSANNYTKTAMANAVTMVSNADATDRVLVSGGANKTAKSSGVSISSLARTTTASSSANGLMSSADKAKLDGIATNANKYVLPTATSSVLGGIKSGGDITVGSDGTVTVNSANDANNADSAKYADKAGTVDTVPVATASTVGGIKLSDDIEVAGDGYVTILHAAKAGEAYCDEDGNYFPETYLKINEAASTYLKASAVTDVTDYKEITL